MKSTFGQKRKESQRLSVFDLLVEIYDWLHVVAASLIVGLIIGFAVYYSKPGKTSLIVAIAIVVTSLVVGIILAANVWKQKGITLSRSGGKAYKD